MRSKNKIQEKRKGKTKEGDRLAQLSAHKAAER